MTDHYIAGLEETIRALRAENGQLRTKIGELHEVVGSQSARLMEQAKAARADKAESALERVREVHRPMPVCPDADGEWFPDYCPCGDQTQHYWVCQECCVDASDCTTEECATYHDHGPGKPICPTMQALDGGAA